MQRRRGTIEKKIRLTPETYEAVEQWATENGVSYSAAVDTLCRLGLGQSPAEAVAPVVVSSIRREIASTYDRIIRLTLFNIIESGIASRMASVAVRELKPGQYEAIRKAAIIDARRSIAKARIGKLIEELYQDGDSEA
jgi:hypothetical protein